MSNLYQKLYKFQLEMKAPKNQYNGFGNFHYRSAENIYESAKPLLAKYGLTLVVSDELVELGGKIYVRANATLYDSETGEHVCSSAFAQDSGEKKGMDPAQVTGTASSYARKYAMNGLFLLDDTKDADTDEFQKIQDAATQKNQASQSVPSQVISQNTAQSAQPRRQRVRKD